LFARPRGHTSLTGAVDAQIAIKRDILPWASSPPPLSSWRTAS